MIHEAHKPVCNSENVVDAKTHQVPAQSTSGATAMQVHRCRSVSPKGTFTYLTGTRRTNTFPIKIFFGRRAKETTKFVTLPECVDITCLSCSSVCSRANQCCRTVFMTN